MGREWRRCIEYLVGLAETVGEASVGRLHWHIPVAGDVSGTGGVYRFKGGTQGSCAHACSRTRGRRRQNQYRVTRSDGDGHLVDIGLPQDQLSAVAERVNQRLL